ncbi:secreted insulinase-like peptidase [Cryptosporidium ubiquitum]|uniref:Secreted insulinase-like peptidase n=1 Tax=Cryptosporidium ubiquitum TaxID=857276 RepID=A0A1J4MB27_9CRYT|nr:secreted insulinase-like peptidase [Cryptosporidium ubiquitum]OII71424.1 secreted insulinase-like peptidase [Cryptosporidium ubiquitum]
MHIKEVNLWLVVIFCLSLFKGEGIWNHKQLNLQWRDYAVESISHLQLGLQNQGKITSMLNPLRIKANQLNSLEQQFSSQVKPKLYTTSKGIKVLLVSDNTMLESAFSFGVGCGYYQDPDNLAGLAHLMEHVVFLGSQENPNPVGWDEFLLKKGGASNAYTSADLTVFYVLSSPRELESVMSYFTNMFVNPVIDERSSVSEIDAVNQEHEKNIPNKVRVIIELAMYLAPKECPARKFGTGSKETLYINSKKNNINLKDALKEYHESCYTSDNVSIVIMGPQSNEQLAKIADNIDKLFTSSRKATKGISKITNTVNSRSVSRGAFKNQHSLAPSISSIFESSGSKKSNIGITSAGGITSKDGDSISKETEQNLDKNTSANIEIEVVRMPRGNSSPPFVVIYWDSVSESLSILKENAEWQMLKLIQYFFEDQSQNSIASELKKKNLATALEYFDNTSTQYSIYGLLFTAIDDSDETTSEIVKLTSAYMSSLIEQINSEDERWIQSFYKNYTNMANIKYEFDEERDTAGIVSQAAESLLIFPDEPEMALSAFVKPVSLNKDSGLSSAQMEALKKFVKHLEPSKIKVIKLSDSIDKSSESKSTFEPYKTEYSISKISVEDPSKTSDNTKVIESTNKIADLLTCVPEDLEIISFSRDKCPKYKRFENEIKERQIGNELQPCPILEEEGLSIFWKGPIHMVPTINLTLVQRLANKDISNNARIALLGKLHAQLQTSRMEYILSSFKLCGLEADINYSRGRFIIKVQSYSSNFEDIIKNLSNYLISESRLPTKAEFEGALSNLKSEILNLSNFMAYDIASEVAQSAYLSNYYSKLQLRDSLQKTEISYDEYLEKTKSVFLIGYFDALIVGNIGSEKAIKLGLNLIESLANKKISYSDSIHDGILDISGDIHIKTNNPISSDKNNAVVAHYLTPPVDLIDVSVYSSIGEILNSPFYDILRTEWQDGYVAFATTKYETPIISLIGAVQSAEKLSETLVCHLFSALEKVSKDVEEDLKEISKSEFEDKIRWFGLSKYSSQKLNSFIQYVEHYGKMIASHELCFEKNKLIENATQVFVSEPNVYIEKLNKLIKPSSSRKLVIVELIGNTNPGEKGNDGKLVSIANVDEPPTNEECKEILKSEMGKVTLMDAISLQLNSSGSSNGKLRASRNNNSKDETKYRIYGSDIQCNVSEDNASSASGKDSKEVKSMLSLFGRRLSSMGSYSQSKANISIESSIGNKKNSNSAGTNKRSSCNYSKL